MEREGKEYGDQEAFLTSAYRKKLEERKRMEEDLREEARREGEDTTQERTHKLSFVCLFVSQKLMTSQSRRISADSTDTSYISKMALLSLLLMRRRPNLPFLLRVGEDNQVNPRRERRKRRERRERREESRQKDKKLLQWIPRELLRKNLLHRRRRA